MRLIRLYAPVLLIALGGLPVLADKPTPAAEYTDDTELLDRFTRKLGDQVKAGKSLNAADLKKATDEDRPTKLTALKPGDKPLSAEELAERVTPSVFLFGSVIGDKKNGYEDGRLATAWAVAADGVLVTNRHVFEQIEDNEFYGAMNHKGEVFPLVEVLAIDKGRDVAVVRIAATGLTPLPLAAAPAKVGSWVGVLGHPGDRYFTFTQGHVSRYSTYKEDDGTRTRWMSITADYAYGSSGSPVVDRFGNVVAIAALTENIDYPDDGGGVAAKAARKPMVRRPAKRPIDDDKKKEEKKPDPAKPAAGGSLLQMVVKMTVPVAELREVLSGGK